MAADAALTAERAAAQRLVDDLRAELAGIVIDQRANPPDDEHDVEGSSVGYERARVAALLVEAVARRAEVDGAIERLAAGSYGTCDACAGPLGEERLAALPTVRHCVTCAAEGRATALGGPGVPTARRLG